ncbi:hypothetical protein G5B39_16370 (plasmid) [Rhodobacteraceae bacterium SC52]|nr:hypothetical protein G5B39_16370 [Rhodobacteraceae bacterium SC52]
MHELKDDGTQTEDRPSNFSPVAIVMMDAALTLALVWAFRWMSLSWVTSLLGGWIVGAFLTVAILFAATIGSELTDKDKD